MDMDQIRPIDRLRFWAKVDWSDLDGCWEWNSGRHEDGYGLVKLRRVMRGAHRVSWAMTYGEWPTQFVLHRCDNPPCVNPAHLFLGTQADNVADRDRKHRCAEGERSPHAKLTEAQVRAIRADPRGGAVVARTYGVSHTNVRFIREGRSWKHLL